MSDSNFNAEKFDVFLCHNTEDKSEIRKIADDLSRRGLKPWLDEREMQPGKPWQAILENQIETIEAAAVFVGKSGLGPWQNMEMRAFISEFVERACPVIPVILPSAAETPKLPILLKSLHWVDFRNIDSDPLKHLIWGITGKKPDHQETNDSPSNDLQIPREANGKDLLPSKATQTIELRLPGNVEEFSPEQQLTLMQSLSALLKIGEVKVTKVVAGSIRLYLELKQEDADKLYSASKAGRLNGLSISDARLYPAIAIPPPQEQRAQLLILLDRVQEYWVDGVLKHSLHHEVLISLGKHAMDETVEPPWKHVIALPADRRLLLLQDRNINTIFDATGLLLILGEPGAGKTTSLLELAASLIQKAKNDPKERVPIVLNLSSWETKQSLEEWMAVELSAKYRVPMTIARTWLTQDYLVPLLDGLDEVHTAIQPDCVAAINAFIENNKPSGLVVCCRLAEYQWLPERLRLNGAVCIEPLSAQDVHNFLAAGGSQLAGLQQALGTDPVLQELSQTPLMLSIMSLAYEGAEGEALTRHRADSPKVRRDHIFRLYVKRMFERKVSITCPFSQDQIMDWLSWLARQMKKQAQSVFMVEELQPRWLDSTGQRLAYEAVTALSVGLIVTLAGEASAVLLGGLTELLLDCLKYGSIIGLSILLGCRSPSTVKNIAVSGLVFGLLVGLLGELLGGAANRIVGRLPDALAVTILTIRMLLIGLLGGIIGSLNEIRLIEIMRWQSTQFWRPMVSGSAIGLLLAGLLDVMNFLLTEHSDAFGGDKFWSFGFFGGLFGAVFGGLSDSVRVDKVSPNQGIRLSLKNGLVALSVSWLLFGLLFSLANEPRQAAVIGLVFGLGIGLSRGGSAVLKHYSLRLILWTTGATPLRFISFLDHCAKLIILKKVGGGYMFIHRTLLEYLSELPDRPRHTRF
ncbi:membrane hypothetical protein [Nitrospira sp. ND1]|uniref:TIR domain-containing protein n=1 Tax=Nitrospira sp. ND1 TaxID=1658518 RepID=UPI0009BC06B7|nr:TIR domain-containing protein [Nitrospira sp. ND1]SLM45459.1 membrane hypothetical protein [Nitrospira sp. ND1]